MDLHQAHAAALERTRKIVAGIGPDQLSLPTPCPDFSVQELLGHLVVGNRRWTAMAQGAPAASIPLEPEPTDDWSAAYDGSATEVGEAWRDPAALERDAALPMVTLPGIVVLGMHVVETLVHGLGPGHCHRPTRRDRPGPVRCRLGQRPGHQRRSAGA